MTLLVRLMLGVILIGFGASASITHARDCIRSVVSGRTWVSVVFSAV